IKKTLPGTGEKSKMQNPPGFSGNPGPCIRLAAGNPKNTVFPVDQQENLIPLPPGDFPVAKKILQFFASPQPQRVKAVTRLPGPHIEGKDDLLPVKEDLP